MSFAVEPTSGFILGHVFVHGFTPAVIQIKSFQDLVERNHECGLI